MTTLSNLSRYGARPVVTAKASAVPGPQPRKGPPSTTGGSSDRPCEARRSGSKATGKTKDNALNIMHWNAEGVNSKRAIMKPSIVCKLFECKSDYEAEHLLDKDRTWFLLLSNGSNTCIRIWTLGMTACDKPSTAQQNAQKFKSVFDNSATVMKELLEIKGKSADVDEANKSKEQSSDESQQDASIASTAGDKSTDGLSEKLEDLKVSGTESKEEPPAEK
ncbi:hypothetical protein EGW08_016361 [Elysia chlorotica]|uniref:Uncharacterized protein n=1 Tax=Elysia chlorotica TaxID=188477 RepID=A0A3S0ZUZ3_ELYCH|nr:hypothetical protein EGW08_016361 [Elysia chlorotica]